jgi:acyl transferase domain-containing protein/acyl carrier protein
MRDTQIAQPPNYLLQVALADLLRSWGIVPAAIVGHSAGEVAAAYVSGLHDLRDAVRVIYHRSRLQQRAAGQGRLLAVGLGAHDARALVAGQESAVSLAAVNSATSIALSGTEAVLTEIAAGLERRGIFNRLVHGDVPYHSPHMDALKPELRDALIDLRSERPRVPLYSTTTGRLVEDTPFDAEYWCDNIREPVLFADAIGAILAHGYTSFLEIGPHPVLGAAIKDSLRQHGMPGDVFACLRREEPERATIRRAVADLYVSGHEIDWRALADGDAQRVKLPSYPWQRERLWFAESPASVTDRLGRAAHPLLGLRVTGPEPGWESDLAANALRYLSDHVVEDAVVFPGSGYVEQGLAIHAELGASTPAVVEDLEFHRALVVTPGLPHLVRSHFDERTREYAVYSRSDRESSEWTLHARGRLAAAPPVAAKRIPLDALRQTCREAVDRDALYARLAGHGLRYGPSFQRIDRLWRSAGQAIAELRPYASANGTGTGYRLHPAVLDASIQSLVAAVETDGAESGPYVPVRIRRIRWYGGNSGSLWSHVQVVERGDNGLAGNIVLCDERGTVVAELLGVHCQPLPSANRDRTAWFTSRMYRPEWVREDRPAAAGHATRWLLLSDDGGFGERLARDLITRAPALHVELLPRGAVDGAAGFDDVVAARPDVEAVVYLWPLDEDARSTDPRESRATVSFLSLVQALARGSQDETPRLYAVTTGTQAIDGELVTGVFQAGIVGLARTALTEHPDLRCTVVDVARASGAAAAGELADELLCDGPDTEVALRRGGRFVCRLARCSILPAADETNQAATLSAMDAGGFRLEIGAPGRIESLRFREMPRRPPAAGEVEIRVLGAALNFKDVLKVTSLLPAQALEGTYHGSSLGMEAAGVISAVGDGVSGYQIGDAVVASIRGSFSSHVTVRVDDLFAVRKLDGMTFVEAASVPVIFMTAYYALHELARLRPGETVLIHAAAGGVGLAAIQVAKWIGATVIATAGSEDKRRYLRSLGVEHVLNSRTLEFADDVMALTQGRGVDVVLNSLSGEALLKSFSIVAPFGRFVEIGKRDIVENTRLPMLAFDRNLSFIAIDLDRIMAERPDCIRRLLAEVWERFRAGDFTTTPIEVVPAAQIAEAFRRMAQSKQIGKIVISFEDLDGLSVVPAKRSRALLAADASYLITGGCGGFGLEVAKWMAAQGARHLVLVGRRGATSPRARETLRVLEAAGVEVTVYAADVSEARDVVDCLTTIGRTMPPLRGIVHAAAVLDDAIMLNLDAARFLRVMAPKAAGAWLLHEHTRDLTLDFFVLFSSVSALVGNLGQANYVAANVYLDTLAHHRRAIGLPATSINWGALAEVGMAAENTDVAGHLARLGIKPIAPRDAVAAMAMAIEADVTQIGFMDVDWQAWRQCQPSTAASPRFSSLLDAREPESGGAASAFRSILLAATAHERSELATLAVVDLIADTMRMSPDSIDVQKPLTDMGIDSLMALELQIAIQTRFGVECSILELQKAGGVRGLAQRLLSRMGVAENVTA